VAQPSDVIAAFLDRFCRSHTFKKLNPQSTPRRLLESKDSPGPKSTPFRREHFRKLEQKPFCVLEKSDGERRFM
jgi:hypothetical protein